MNEPTFHSTGHIQEVSPHRQQHASDVFDDRYTYAVKSQTHLWIVTLCHHAGDQLLDQFETPGGQPLLDAETLAFRPGVGCYVCEQTYEPRLRHRKCPGEPR